MITEAMQTPAFWIEVIKILAFALFSVVLAGLSINQKVQLDVIEPEDSKDPNFEWTIKSVGSKRVFISKVIGYDKRMMKSVLQPGETTAISSFWGASKSGGVIYYKRFKLLPNSKSVIFGKGIDLSPQKAFWSNLTFEERLPRIYAWWHANKFLRMSRKKEFKLEVWPTRLRPSFRLREMNPGIGDGGLELELKLDYPLPAFYKMRKRILKTEPKVNREGFDNLKLEWIVSRGDIRKLAKHLISKQFSIDVRLSKDPRTPHDFLLKHLLDRNADEERKREIFKPQTISLRTITMRRSTTEKYISMSAVYATGVHFSIYNPNYVEDKFGMLFRSKTPRSYWFGRKRPERKIITVFVDHIGTVVVENSNGMSESARLNARDFSRFMSMIAEWKIPYN